MLKTGHSDVRFFIFTVRICDSSYNERLKSGCLKTGKHQHRDAKIILISNIFLGFFKLPKLLTVLYNFFLILNGLG